MANEYRVYINTLVFALVSIAVLLSMLLALMFITALASYAAFCITIAIGLLLVVIGAVIRIWLYQTRMKEMARTIRDNTVVVQTCPDYYTATNHMDGTVICSNSYVTGDGTTEISFLRGPATIDLSKYDKMTLREVCDDVDPTNPNAHNYNIPWTNLRGTCAGQNLG